MAVEMIGRNQVIERDRDRVVARTAFGGTQHDGTFSADVGARDAQGRQDKRNASLTAPTFARRWVVFETLIRAAPRRLLQGAVQPGDAGIRAPAHRLRPRHRRARRREQAVHREGIGQHDRPEGAQLGRARPRRS
jgi:hypothetical protein